MTRMLHGVPIYESELIVIDGEPYLRRRTWKERLFSRPWRPWRAYRKVVPKIPDPNYYMSSEDNPWGKCIFAHPQTARRLYEKIDRGEI